MKIPYLKEILLVGVAMNVFLLLTGIALEDVDTIVLAIASGAMCSVGLKAEKMCSEE
jgi:hypothetical protein